MAARGDPNDPVGVLQAKPIFEESKRLNPKGNAAELEINRCLDELGPLPGLS